MEDVQFIEILEKMTDRIFFYYELDTVPLFKNAGFRKFDSDNYLILSIDGSFLNAELTELILQDKRCFFETRSQGSYYESQFVTDRSSIDKSPVFESEFLHLWIAEPTPEELMFTYAAIPIEEDEESYWSYISYLVYESVGQTGMLPKLKEIYSRKKS